MMSKNWSEWIKIEMFENKKLKHRYKIYAWQVIIAMILALAFVFGGVQLVNHFILR